MPQTHQDKLRYNLRHSDNLTSAEGSLWMILKLRYIICIQVRECWKRNLSNEIRSQPLILHQILLGKLNERPLDGREI